jgi:hypothetical protein
MEVCYPVLREESDEIKSSDRVFAFRWGEDRAIAGLGWAMNIK